ncbi:hypothetical protein ACFQ48_14290 [Hymenobacter caeli]|uniref:Uncharacterized protein n=1 Tax=Hymenobacter caeli TaxID=2735894 RepID=A0ABX2FUS3_9BACT|nr:hypothetical protein [Hymenobacter caeli]NRT20089.1 hypothetical protein [Hymenobacter caeli]
MKAPVTTSFIYALLLLLPLLVGSSCSREEEQQIEPATFRQLVIAAADPSQANQTNKLLAYISSNHITQYHYGDFDADGQPGKINQLVVADASSGLSLNAFLDDSLRVKTLYCSKGVVKDTLLFTFTYPNATTIVLSAYRIDWASDYTKLRKRVVLNTSNNAYAISGVTTYNKVKIPIGPLASPASMMEQGNIPYAMSPSGIIDSKRFLEVPLSASSSANKWLTVLGTNQKNGPAHTAGASRTTAENVGADIREIDINSGKAVAAVGYGFLGLGAIGAGLVAFAGGTATAITTAFVVYGAIGAFIILSGGISSAQGAELSPSDKPFKFPPSNTPDSPTTQINGTQLQRLKIYTAISESAVTVVPRVNSVCCDNPFLYTSGVLEFKFGSGKAVGRGQVTVIVGGCDGTYVGSGGKNIFFLTSASVVGNNLTLNFGDSKFLGTMTTRGGTGVLTINTIAVCSASGVSAPYSVNIPMSFAAIN